MVLSHFSDKMGEEMTIDVKLDKAGRLMVPHKLRRELGLDQNSRLLVRVEDGGLRVETREVALRRLQEYMRKFKKPGESVVDEFLAERREEARREWPKK
jgi:AbrB family looped-hinge helix DNA binding protein